MSDDVVKLEIDGQEVEAKKGEMLIAVTDRIGAYVPRFCYHEKLSVAANCRMCLVEVEKAPKPLPACATPVGDGMKVFTRSPYAIAAQKATMEFLLINHPLDCPICDQGGECELQDLAMGYGRDVSRFVERKRVVKDKDIGPLVSTDMTRCIHCTRCIRFGEEVTGRPELGTTDRGEDMKVGTYIEKSIDHELSANIIDLCPVGALNNKPYRYSARAWEMQQRATVSGHDCVGSNLHAHVLRGTVKRIVPRVNEAINETWIADRDRFSYEGVYSQDRLLAPRAKIDGQWQELSWEAALERLAKELSSAERGRTGFLLSPNATTEEGHLAARLADHLQTGNIDHRLRRQDFSDQDNDPVAPSLGTDIAALESADALLVVGSDVRREAPILAHRIRKAAVAGASVNFVDEVERRYFFDTAAYLHDDGLVNELMGVAVAACKELPTPIRDMCKGVNATAAHKDVAKALQSVEHGVVLLGVVALHHPAAGAITALAAAIANAAGATLGFVTDGANAVGLHLAGVLPHRHRAGLPRGVTGQTAPEIAAAELDALLVLGAEPGSDMPPLTDSKHRFVAALTPFRSTELDECTDLQLPIGTYFETSGTFVNCEGRWQSFGGVANPIGQARPGWKVLRVLGNLLDAPDFDFETSTAVLDELRGELGEIELDTTYSGDSPLTVSAADAVSVQPPMYSVDGIVRRAVALQLTPEARRASEAAA